MFALLARMVPLAQFVPDMSDDKGAFLFGMGLLLFLFLFLIGLAVGVFVCYVIYAVQNRVPREHRKLEPALVWLLLVPFLNIVWVFVVTLKVSESLKSYFDAQDDTSVGDCGRGVGLGWAVCMILSLILSWIPVLKFIIGLAGLICVILFLVKVNELKNRIPVSGSAAA